MILLMHVSSFRLLLSFQSGAIFRFSFIFWNQLERWEESLRDYSALSKEMPGDHVIADALLQVQAELKKAKGVGGCNIEL